MTTDPPLDDPATLITSIETRFTRPTVRNCQILPLKVERVNGDSPAAPYRLGAPPHHLIGALEVHVKKEERILFPAIRRGGGRGSKAPSR